MMRERNVSGASQHHSEERPHCCSFARPRFTSATMRGALPGGVGSDPTHNMVAA